MSSTVSAYSKSALRTVKNYTKGYSDVQTKVRAATSNDPWGPSGTQMNEIAQFTYNQQDFVEIMEMLDKRLNDKGKNWRHVFKALTVLDYCLHAGSENVVLYFKENLYIVKTLKDFVYIDEDGKDQGQNIRQKAKDITNLLQDESRLRDERRTRSNMRERLSGRSGSEDDRERPARVRSAPPARRNEDDDLQRALEASKRSAEEESKRKTGDADLEEALRLSKEEDERRKRELEAARNSLFDQDAQNQLIDLNSQPTQQLQPQYTAYNPYADAQAAMQRQQEEEYLRMQQQMEYQRQLDLQRQQQEYQQMLQQQAMQQQMYLQSQQTGFQPQPLVPQPTAFGSNNPFAQFANNSDSLAPPQQPQRPSSQPKIDLPGTFASSSSSAPRLSPSPAPVQQRPPRDDGQHAKLAALIGAREDGIDTFGNVGSLRIPVGSPFHPSNRLQASKTGPATLQAQQTGFGNVAGAPTRGTFDRSATAQQQQNSSQPFFEI